VAGEPLRIAIAVAAVASLILGGVAAHADKRMFIVANDADGYGVDRCLISNAPCGTAVANSYCHSHEYDQALSFQKVDRGDITALPRQADRAPAKVASATNLSLSSDAIIAVAPNRVEIHSPFTLAYDSHTSRR
jgi:hypothetical protein